MPAHVSIALLLTLLTLSCKSMPSSGSWCPLESGSAASLRGLSAVDSEIAWASGSGGTILRTLDGTTWEALAIPGTDDLDFRDVEAFDADTAVVISAGTPARVYRTSNGGRTWSLVYDNPDDRAFFDAMAFWDDRRGLAFSDPIDGRLLVIATADGGQSWHTLPPDSFPPSPEGEAGFAASGTCLAVSGEGTAWVGTGGTAGARVFRTEDGGTTWEAVPTPMLAGESSRGIFSLVSIANGSGIAVGGDYTQPDLMEANVARTRDGGVTWEPIEGLPPTGYRSCVALVEGREDLMVAVGPNGTDFSIDGGRTWRRLSDEGYHVVASGDDGTIWAAGSDGRIAKLLWQE